MNAQNLPHDGDTFTRRIAEFFRANPNRWIQAQTLQSVGGICAWRTRVSDARRAFGMRIENRVRRVKRDDGTTFAISEYRLVQDETTCEVRAGGDARPSPGLLF